MRKLLVIILLTACALALEVSGSTEVLKLARGQSAQQSVQLKNNTNQAEDIRVDYFLEKHPDGEKHNYRLLLSDIGLNPEITQLWPNSEQDYTWQIKTDEYTAPGEYLFWLVFSKEIYNQGNEEGDFIVQDAVYFPLRYLVEIKDN